MKTEGIKDKVTLTSELQEFKKLRQKVEKDVKKGSTTEIKEAPSILKLDLALSRAIHSQLRPETILEERKEKVEKIKALIKAGQYNPKVEDIAVKFITGASDEVSLLKRLVTEA